MISVLVKLRSISSRCKKLHHVGSHPTLLTQWCRVLLEKLTGLQLVKKHSAFHGTWRFITALTSVRHLSLSWASPIQSIYTHPTSWRSVLILSAHLRLGLPSGLLPSSFPTKTLYTPLSTPIRATCPAHLILLDFIWLWIPCLYLHWFFYVFKYCESVNGSEIKIHSSEMLAVLNGQ